PPPFTDPDGFRRNLRLCPSYGSRSFVSKSEGLLSDVSSSNPCPCDTETSASPRSISILDLVSRREKPIRRFVRSATTSIEPRISLNLEFPERSILARTLPVKPAA